MVKPCEFCDPEGAGIMSYGALVKQMDYSRVIIGYITYLDFSGEYPRLITEGESTIAEHRIHFCPECGRDLDAEYVPYFQLKEEFKC